MIPSWGEKATHAIAAVLVCIVLLRVTRVKMADVYFSARAYCKILLHSVKYPHCAINGLLLAKAKNKSDEKSTELQIVDAVPLFHICLHVSPMAEVALTMVSNKIQLSKYFYFVNHISSAFDWLPFNSVNYVND